MLKWKKMQKISGSGPCLILSIFFFSCPYQYIHQETLLKHAMFAAIFPNKHEKAGYIYHTTTPQPCPRTAMFQKRYCLDLCLHLVQLSAEV